MASLKKQFISGVVYTAAAKYIGIFIQLIITAILSRLLTPEDFGVVAIATVFIVFFGLLSDMGIGAAVIQSKALEKKELESIFSLSIYVGCGLTVIFFITSYWIAIVYNRPILKDVCRLLSLNVLFASLNVVPNALLLKEKQFKFIAIRTLLVQVISGIVGIVAALMEWGIYALIVYAIISSFLLFIVNYFKEPLAITLNPKKGALEKISGFSTYQFCFNFINYFSRNLDTLFIGKFLSPALLGYYDKAYRLMLLPVQNLTQVLSPVVLPFFSDFRENKQRIYEGYLKIIYLLALIGFPLSAFLHFTAKEIIIIIFGNQWMQAVPVFEVLAWSVGLQVVLSSSGAIFQAANNTRFLFISGLLSAALMIVCICYGVFIARSITGTAYALLIAFFVNFLQCYTLLIKIVLKGSLKSFFSIFKVPLVLFLLVTLGEFIYTKNINIDEVVVNFIFKTLIAACIVIVGIIIFEGYASVKASILSVVKKS